MNLDPFIQRFISYSFQTNPDKLYVSELKARDIVFMKSLMSNWDNMVFFGGKDCAAQTNWSISILFNNRKPSSRLWVD